MRRVIALLLIAVSSWWLSPAIQAKQSSPPDFSAKGLFPKRSYFAQFPFENVDMINGNLLLRFVDLSLPGNAGMDLRIERSFNKQTGLWRMGLGGVPMEVIEADAPWPEGDPSRHEPGLMMADGTIHFTRPVNGPLATDVWITPQFWRYTLATRTVELPNGWTATYVQGEPRAVLQEVHDGFGNQISVAWEPYNPNDVTLRRPATISQTVGAQTRHVTFTYETSWSTMPKTMTFGDRTWDYSYTYDPIRLISVAPPVGPAWQFDYTTGLKVTTPNGGTVEYGFEDQTFPDDGLTRPVVRTRITGGRAVNGGSWTFTYTPQSPTQVGCVGRVETPSGPTLEFTHEWSGLAGRWVFTRKEVRDGQTVVASLERGYTHLNVLAWGGATEPVVESDVINQTGRTYNTTYEYSANDEDHHFGDYHRPFQITESGDLTRVTTRAFDYDFYLYLLDRIGAISTTVNGETFTITREYNNGTGFLEREVKYGIPTRFLEDGKGNVAVIRDEHNHDITHLYKYGVIKDTSTPMYPISRELNVDGTVASETRRGFPTSFSYDALGRQTNVDPPTGHDITTAYDPEGDEITTHRGPNGPSTTSTLDGFGRVIATANAVGVRTRTEYDKFGRKTYESFPYTTTDVGTTFTYDALGRLTRATTSDNKRVQYDYSNGVDVTITDEENRPTVQNWAAFGDPSGDARLLSVTDAQNAPWNYEYNALGRLTRVTQPGGSSRQWTYWPTMDLLRDETHPESGVTSYFYDGAGRLESKTTPRGTFSFGYDANDRLTIIDAPGTAHDVTLDYDASDNRTLLRNSFVDSRFEYDGADRRNWRKDTIPGQPERQTTYGYDEWDNVKTLTYPSTRTLVYDYDRENRVTRVTRDGGTLVAQVLAYHPSGALKQLQLGNGITETFDYHVQRYWLTRVSGGPLDVTYGHDGVGNVTTLVDNRPGFNQTFAYDAIDRLRFVTGFGTNEYRYDELGNRTFKANPQVTYTYDPVTKRLITASGPTPNPEIGSYQYTGDAGAAGNLTQDPSGSYSYTPFNMLETAAVGGTSSTYRYDADNVRCAREGSSATDFFYGDTRVFSEFRRLTSTAWVRDYIYLGTRLVASVSAPTGPSVRFADQDNGVTEGYVTKTLTVVLSTPQALTAPLTVQYTTSNGTAVAPYDYLSTSGTIDFPIGSSDGATRTISVKIVNNTLHEDVEAFSVGLSNVVGGHLGAPAGISIVIVDNDPVSPPPPDFNDDGHHDLVWRNETTGYNAFWLMSGPTMITSVPFTPNQQITAASGWKIRAIGDMDADHNPDVIWHNTADGRVSAWLFIGTACATHNGQVCQSSYPITINGEIYDKGDEQPTADWRIVGASDMDRDGQVDLVWQERNEGRLRIWHMTGTDRRDEVIVDLTLGSEPTLWDVVGLGDMNGDGWQDLVWQHSGNGGLAAWFLTDTHVIQPTWLNPANNSTLTWKIVGVADIAAGNPLVRDGKPDLIWQRSDTGHLAVWYMDGIAVKPGGYSYLSPSQITNLEWWIVGVR